MVAITKTLKRGKVKKKGEVYLISVTFSLNISQLLLTYQTYKHILMTPITIRLHHTQMTRKGAVK